MADPTNKAELLEKMRSGYASFEALLAPLSAEQLSEAGVNGAWSIKDILAHLSAWQTRVSLRLEALARQEEAGFDPIENDEQMNAFNARVFEANRTRPLNAIQEEFRASVQRLDANVEQTDERDLFEPGRLAWLKDGVLWEAVAGNSFGHYDEHTPMIKKWLAGQSTRA
jgi:hypothetical protein